MPISNLIPLRIWLHCKKTLSPLPGSKGTCDTYHYKQLSSLLLERLTA
jgi:hypothetical protein